MRRLWQNVEHYLLISVTLSFGSGILFHHLYPLSLPTAARLSILLFIPALILARRNATRWPTVFLLLLVFSLGIFRATISTHAPRQDTNIGSRISEETDVVLSGTLHSMPLFDGEKTTLLLKSRSVQKEQDPFLSAVSGLVRLRLYEPIPKTFKPGDELLIRCKLSRPYRFGNPGGFDYPAFLATKNIALVGRITSTAHIQPLQYEKNWLRTLRYTPENIRCQVRDVINDFFPPAHAGIYRALLIGDRSGIDKNQFETFKASGVVHIFAISGLHLSLVASALFLLCYWLLTRSRTLLLHFSCKKLALLATIAPLCCYTLLAGTQTPVLRSLIMVLVFILAFCVQRQRSAFTTLSLAALLILLYNPLSLFTVSFQLSFAAVASLIFIVPRLTDMLSFANDAETTVKSQVMKKFLSWIAAALLVSVTATIGTAPLLLYFFNRISTVGPLANLLLEPLLCLWSLPFGLLAIPFLSIAPPVAEFLFAMGDLGITVALTLSDFFSGLSLSTLWFATPSIPLILCYYASLLFCFSRFSSKQTVPVFLLICLLFFFPPRAFRYGFSTLSELVFLDVGQGSSTFLSLPDGKTVLIDGGGASSKKFNVGESVIAPYLWHRGLTRLHAILISHPDADHYNGIPFLLQRFKPETLWVNGDSGHDRRYRDLLDLARKLDIKVRTVQGGQLILAGEGGELRSILNPLQGAEHENSNDRSIILRFTDHTFSCILPGDISSKVEQALLRNNTQLKTDILLSPHHGSRTSSSYPFLNRLKPKQIVVSAGRFRPEHFPSARLRSYCLDHNIPLLNTTEQGAIKVRIAAGKSSIKSFNASEQKIR